MLNMNIPTLIVSASSLIAGIYCLVDFLKRKDWTSLALSISLNYLGAIYLYIFFTTVENPTIEQQSNIIQFAGIYVRLGIILIIVAIIMDRIIVSWSHNNGSK